MIIKPIQEYGPVYMNKLIFYPKNNQLLKKILISRNFPPILSQPNIKIKRCKLYPYIRRIQGFKRMALINI